MLIDLASVTGSLSTTVTATALPLDLQVHITISLGFLAADAFLATRRKSSLQQTTKPNPTHTASPPPVMAIPRATDHVLAFLDHEFWVCSYTLSETRPGRIKRHFFLPRDWLNLGWLELAVMRTDGVLVCPRYGEVVGLIFAILQNLVRQRRIC